ncbi:hypothetical protein [Actinoplanes friuliensis]|jgi:hypothetical protein|uniref:Gram-positive cocci surface proteins LPxTG domain-containing protein n=1 Tax=Actinoplanes friuliensis DSM 7358 TaxID=1246995 RepID=U5VS20_9ACTN|nr:hypothetical protein [Actinoplanes friuliensis]AGZ39778.1 hypothetical protein AFR_07445 [Actinoplanes friuliensis DSM 7358]
MRTSVPAALAAIALAMPVVLLESSPALAADVFVETNPSTVRAGDDIGIRASCDDNLKPATVTAGPIGTVTVSPSYGFLTTTTRVPSATDPGDYPVRLKCPDGKTAENTLHVVVKVEPARGPATGGGGTAEGRSAPLLIGGGLAALGAAAALGVAAARRRRLG